VKTARDEFSAVVLSKTQILGCSLMSYSTGAGTVVVGRVVTQFPSRWQVIMSPIPELAHISGLVVAKCSRVMNSS